MEYTVKHVTLLVLDVKDIVYDSYQICEFSIWYICPIWQWYNLFRMAELCTKVLDLYHTLHIKYIE